MYERRARRGFLDTRAGSQWPLAARLVALSMLALACTSQVACGIQRRIEAFKPDAGPTGLDAGRSHAVGVPLPASDAGEPNLPAPDSSIAIENRQPGSDDFAIADGARADMDAYASSASLAPGEALRLYVNVDHDQDVRWELYRIGYYQGHGARLMASGEPTRVNVQPSCPIAPDSGLIECHWSSAFQVQIDPMWVSGYYAFKLLSEDGSAAYVPLIVREGSKRAPIVVQASVTTWQAYNTWGGTSLYKNKTHDSGYSELRAHRVSFDRPYDTRASAFNKETQLVRWLEQRGYAASYVTNLDVEADRSLLDQRKLFVTVLHDEYWTVAERDALEQARDAGVSLAFLSANTGYWRIRLDPSSAGVPRRVITCYKSASLDPQRDAPDTTAQFRQQPVPRPENALLGEMYGDWSDFGGFPFVVANHEHWIYAGTSVAEHETLSAIIGIEWDAVADNGLTPSGIEIVGDSPVVSQVGVPFPHAQASVYYPTPTSFVFAAGTINWITGLGGDNNDPRVQRMTENLFARAGFALAQPTRVEAPALHDVGHPAETKVLAGSPEPGVADGPGATARFSSPAGVAAATSGELFVADTGNRLVRKIDNAGNVTTLAGCRPDAEPRATCLTNPVGVAVDAHGAVYVSDAGQHRIYVIDKAGEVSVFAGTGEAGFGDSSEPRRASFATPRGLALGPSGELYVADFDNAAIRRIDAAGVTTLARNLSEVMGVAADSQGNVYFTSSGNQPLGVLRDAKPQPLTGEPVRPLEGLIVGADGIVFADAGNYRVRRLVSEQGPIVTWLGNGQFGATDTQLVLPRGIAAARGGYVVADSGNHRIVWFRPAP